MTTGLSWCAERSLWALEQTHVCVCVCFFLSWPRWQISMLLMAEILYQLGCIRPCKQWEIPPPSISNVCLFQRCFWYLIWNVPTLGSVPFFGPHGLGGGKTITFFVSDEHDVSRVCPLLYQWFLRFNRITKHWSNVCVCSCNWGHFSWFFGW